MSEIIKAEGIKRCFKIAGNDFYALKGIDIAVPKNSLTILKGRSGSGKTTLLNIIGCLDKQTDGTLVFDGVDITDYTEKQLEKIRRNEIGFIFQSVALIPVMSAYQNVEYSLRISGYEGDRDERVKECLAMVNLTKRASHMPEELSGGEQQRVAIARAIAHKPKVIFADEPTGELDSYTSLKVITLFKELIAKEGITIVMTTHDPKMMEYGDVVYEILDGQILSYKNNLTGETAAYDINIDIQPETEGEASKESEEPAHEASDESTKPAHEASEEGTEPAYVASKESAESARKGLNGGEGNE